MSWPCPIGFADARCMMTSWHARRVPEALTALVRSIPESLRALAQNLTFIGANPHRLYFYSQRKWRHYAVEPLCLLES